VTVPNDLAVTRLDWQERGRRLRAPMDSVGADSAVSIRCPSAIVAALRAAALAQDCTISQLVRRILQDALLRDRRATTTRAAKKAAPTIPQP
jgi:hypothetical protein